MVTGFECGERTGGQRVAHWGGARLLCGNPDLGFGAAQPKSPAGARTAGALSLPGEGSPRAGGVFDAPEADWRGVGWQVGWGALAGGPAHVRGARAPHLGRLDRRPAIAPQAAGQAPAARATCDQQATRLCAVRPASQSRTDARLAPTQRPPPPPPQIWGLGTPKAWCPAPDLACLQQGRKRLPPAPSPRTRACRQACRLAAFTAAGDAATRRAAAGWPRCTKRTACCGTRALSAPLRSGALHGAASGPHVTCTWPHVTCTCSKRRTIETGNALARGLGPPHAPACMAGSRTTLKQDLAPTASPRPSPTRFPQSLKDLGAGHRAQGHARVATNAPHEQSAGLSLTHVATLHGLGLCTHTDPTRSARKKGVQVRCRVACGGLLLPALAAPVARITAEGALLHCSAGGRCLRQLAAGPRLSGLHLLLLALQLFTSCRPSGAWPGGPCGCGCSGGSPPPAAEAGSRRGELLRSCPAARRSGAAGQSPERVRACP